MDAKSCHDCFWALAMPGYKTPSGSVVYCCHPRARAKVVLAPVAQSTRADSGLCGPSARWYKHIPPEDFIPIVRGASPKAQRVIAPQYTSVRNRIPYKVP